MTQQEHTFKNGVIIKFDLEDHDLVETGCWWSGRYAKTQDDYLHRLIVRRVHGEIPKGCFVDHINGDPKDNRRGNLRIVTKAQNAANAASRGGKSQYRGVFAGRNGKWVAQISKRGKTRCLGTFQTEEQAARAYDKAAIELHGEYARPNFCGPAGKEQ